MSATEPKQSSSRNQGRRRKEWLRKTLKSSQKEAVASATMTASSDNFLNAFAIHLQATSTQMGLLTAIPQFVGALMQLISVWLGSVLPRRPLVYSVAGVQALVVALIAVLALSQSTNVFWLITLAVLYHACQNLIQPQWRAWMGSIVPERRRGVFFAGRTKLTMIASLGIFLGGGALLSISASIEAVWLGFTLLFLIASTGRGFSSFYLHQMHDPDVNEAGTLKLGLRETIAPLISSLKEPTFRNYTIFVAGMQGMVAISAPFFAVYMLNELKFSYFQFSLNAVVSIATQFLTLGLWGRISDQYGNRLVMTITSAILPSLPVLWLFSPNEYYLLLVQAISGFAWSGFSLSTANYLYDIRPHKTHFAAYAAVQSSLGATAIFIGALLGGFVAAKAPTIAVMLPESIQPASALFIVFFLSGAMRAGITLWFIPRAVEPRIRKRPAVLQIVFRVSRFNPISGVVLDWLTVTRKRRSKKKEEEKSPQE